MNIAVLIKMVPDTESKLEVNDGTLIDQNFKYMVNPYDEFAVEQAVQFKEAEGGKVTLLSLFSEDNSIDTDLRKMLAIGADEIVVLRQNGYRGDKPLANAKVLSDAIKELDVDLVLCGIQGIDYYQAATGTMVAQMLGMPNISGVTSLEYNSGTLKAKRQIEGGLQTVETPTPAVITCQKDMNKVRFPALKDIMMSKRKPFENKNVDSNFHLYTLQLADNPRFDRYDLFTYLQSKNYQPMVHYIPVHLLGYYKKMFGYKRGDFPVSEQYYDRSVSLPLYPSLTDDEVEKVGREIRETVLKWTGIPTSIGIAKTKTLSKVANHIAKKKKSGVTSLIGIENIDPILEKVEINS